MMNKNDEELYHIWDQRWHGAEGSECITFIGRLMFRAKKRLLEKIISSIEVETVIEVGCGLGHTLKVFHDGGYELRHVEARDFT